MDKYKLEVVWAEEFEQEHDALERMWDLRNMFIPTNAFPYNGTLRVVDADNEVKAVIEVRS